MLIRFIWPGRTKDERLRSLVDEYLKRLSRFVRCEVVEVRDSKGSDPAAVKKESQRLLEAVPPRSRLVLLDVNGREFTSPGLAHELKGWEQDSTREVAIVIGGPAGVSAEVSRRAQHRWRLTHLTLTHEMARVIVVEQLYRAYTINRGLKYQK